MNLILFAASLRRDSFNQKLIDISADSARRQQVHVNQLNFPDFCKQFYNADVENSQGIPSEIQLFSQYLQQSSGMLIAVPEYNGGIPGALKNLIDWVSRIRPSPLKGYPVSLISASPSPKGGTRGLEHTRQTLEACACHLNPDYFSLASAPDAFDEQGRLTDREKNEQLYRYISNVISFTQKSNTVTEEQNS